MISFDLLKIIPDLVEHKNISRAALNANISQPALSQKIINTEKELGIQLFHRSNKGVELTKAGKIINDHAIEMLNIYHNMLKNIENLQSDKQLFHILTTPIVCSYILPSTFYQNPFIFPKYTLEIESMASAQIEEQILQSKADIGVIIGKPDNEQLIYKKIWTDTHHLVCSIDANIPAKISINDLYDYSFIMLTKRKKTRKLLDSYFEKININLDKLSVLYEVDSNEAMKLSIMNGNDLAFLPSLVIKQELKNKQVRIVELENFYFEEHYYIIHQKFKNPNSAHQRNFINYFEKMTKETII